MASPLLSIPTELLEGIVAAADDQAVFSLRLTCREMQMKTHNAFVQRFFATRMIGLDRNKIQELVAIAEVPCLATAVHRLAFLCQPGRLNELTSEENTEENYANTNQVFVQLVASLTLAMSKLPNIDTIDITDKYAKVPEEDEPETDEMLYDVSEAFSAIMNALSMSGAQPMSIYVYSVGMRYALFGVRTLSGSPSLATSLKRLKNLKLEVLESYDEGPDLRTLPGTQLGSLMAMSQSLTRLALSFEGRSSSYAMMEELAKSVFLPQLEKLGLESIETEFSTLSELISRHTSSLRDLHLSGVFAAGDGDIHSFLKSLQTLALSHLILARLFVGDVLMGFPRMAEILCDDEVDEDGWLGIRFKGWSVFSSEGTDVSRFIDQLLERVEEVPS